MDFVKLQASVRGPNISPKNLRRNGSVPCVIYGHEAKNQMLQCDERALHKAFAKAGESTLVELEIAGPEGGPSGKVPVLFKDIDFDPVSGREVHVDFYAVNMKEEIETQVPLHFEGEALAVKDLAGILVTPHDHVKVRCLPADLPHALTVDISPLQAFHDVITVAAIKLPKGVTIIESPETVVATVQEPRKEEEIAPPPTETVPAEGEAAATAEGASAAEGAASGAKVEAAAGGKEKK